MERHTLVSRIGSKHLWQAVFEEEKRFMHIYTHTQEKYRFKTPHYCLSIEIQKSPDGCVTVRRRA